MDERTVSIMGRYHAYVEQRKKPQEGFWSKFLRRTSFRARQLYHQPVESVIYYTLSALPVPMWSEQDAGQVTSYISQRLTGKSFEPPQLPSEREEALLKKVAVNEFKRFLAQDPQAKAAFVQHYRDQQGRVPIEIHALLPRPAVRPKEFLSKIGILQHFSGFAKRVAQRKPVPQALQQRRLQFARR